jgi:hypothetical protein
MCNKFKVKHVEIDGRRVKMPLPKTVDEIARWEKRVRGDNSKDREKRRADDSWVLEDDFVALLGFGEPMMGYHGNQCFDVLDRWQDICRLPVLTMLDVYLSRYADVYQPVPEEHSALRKWLGGLRDMRTQLRRTRPCSSRLAKGIDDWVGALVSISDSDGVMYTFKMYDHFCCVHVAANARKRGKPHPVCDVQHRA